MNINKKIISIFIIIFYSGICILPVPGLNNTYQTDLCEKITENTTNEIHQQKNMLFTKTFYENNSHEKINNITINNNFDSKESIHISTNRFQFNKLINKPILWEYLDNYSIPLVSICDNGSYIWTGQCLNNPRFQLFETIGSGLPEWEYILPEKDEITLIDSSAENCILAGVIFIDYWNSTIPNSILFKWDISSNTPKWCFKTPDDLYPGALCVSNDGSRIVLATYNQSQQIIKIFVFNSDSNETLLIYPIDVPEQYAYVYSLDISYDGLIILVNCGFGSFIIDVNAPKIRWSGEQLPSSISADGSILVYNSYKNGNIMNLLKWDSHTNEYVIKWQNKYTPDDWLIQLNGHTLTISDDGSTILAAVNYKDFLENKVVLFDANNGDILWRHYSEGYGKLQNVIYDVKLSYNGSKIMIGYWGDDYNTIPIIKIFNKSNENPALNIYFSGSTMSIDISSDGKFNVAACKMIHANLMGYGGVIYAIEAKNIFNNPPDKPKTPTGPKTGTIGNEYNYSTDTIDSDSDKIFYLFDWGDGSTSGWIGLCKSGDNCQGSHIWSKKSNYDIKVKAKDVYGAESDWSDPLSIKIPYSNDNLIPLFFKLLFERFSNALPQLRK